MNGPRAAGASGVRAVLYLPRAEDVEASCAPLAGHPVAFRAFMSALRAGCASVEVPAVFRGTPVERAIEAHPRAQAACVWLTSAASLSSRGATLLVPSTSILPLKNVRALVESHPVTVLAGSPDDAPVALVPHAVVEPLAKELAAGQPVGLALRVALDGAPIAVSPSPWSVRATTEPARREAEYRLLADLGSAIDTWFDAAVHRPLSRRLTPMLVRLGVTPNTISMLSVAIGVAAAWGWASATVGGALLGLALYFVSVVLDHSDGEVARLTFAESRLGEWLDTLGDTVVHVGGALAMGLAAERLAGWGLLYGALAALGFAASALVSKTSRRPAAADSLARTVTALGTRDGFYVLLVLFLLTVGLAPAAVPYLVLLAAAGSHVFWLSALAARTRTTALERKTPRKASSREESTPAAKR